MTKTDTLPDLIRAEIRNGANGILTATTGTNGNGGQWADAETIAILLDHGEYDGTDWHETDTDRLERHADDAGLDIINDVSGWRCWERIEMDANGYVTGLRSLVYLPGTD